MNVTGAAAGLRLITVPWDDPRGVAMREAMTTEMAAVYADVPVSVPAGQDPVEFGRRRAEALSIDPASVVTTVLVVDGDGVPLAHGVLRRLGEEWEVKRVLVADGLRGRGIGAMTMAGLESAALDDGADRVILQTGLRQPDAVALYRRIGYQPIPLYEPYTWALPGTIAFAKPLRAVG